MIIGEAVKNLPASWRESRSEIAWSKIGRMRDRLIHNYFEVDYDIVWDVLTVEIPGLRAVRNRAAGGDGKRRAKRGGRLICPPQIYKLRIIREE